MSKHHGFELIEERDIPEINSHVRLFRHIKTGARLLSIENDDENKVFGVGFRTPPRDNTGVAHILEHSVLAGSRKYRVKEPFVELIKGSLNTFLNAFTYPDRTVYPVASQNLKDFYNLIDVYMDAVFYPLLRPLTFRQEGWHYEMDEKDDISYKGVVFNEMKGVYASPDSVLGERIQQSLFPDTLYRLDYGGHPHHIPDLSYEQFKTFHDEYYHPANAWIYFYGNDKAEKRLKLMDKWLRDFGHEKVDSNIPAQPRWTEPRSLRQPFMAGEDSKAYVTVNWLLNETGDAEMTLALNVLDHILMGTPASPLRKALIDSGLGEDVAGGGLEDELRQYFFAAGLKGTTEDKADAIERLIFDTLQKLTDEGIDRKTVEASLNTIEFMLREMNTGRFPRGLLLYIRALAFWLYDADPLAPLAFEAPLQRIKEQAQADAGYFEGLIRRYLLENPHRTRLVLYPDAELKDRWEEQEAARLADEKARMAERDLARIKDEMAALRRLQEEPDDPAALAAIPRLKLKDLDKTVRVIPTEEQLLADGQLLYHDLATNGILYLDVGLNLAALPAHLISYVPLYARALLHMGNEGEDFVALSQRIGSKTGGVTTSTLMGTSLRERQPVTHLVVRGKATVEHAGDLADILRDILLTTRFDDKERFRQILLEEKARQEGSLIPMGHLVVNSRLRAHFTVADWLNEQMSGVSYLFFLRDLIDRLDDVWPETLTHLRRINDLLVARGNALWNVTLDDANWNRAQDAVSALIQAIPDRTVTPVSWRMKALPPQEGLIIPAQVNYVAKGASLYDAGYKLDGSVFAINAFLRTSWLWEQVRMKGGAYGAFTIFDHRSGVLDFVSYRDPNLLDTLAAYDATADFLKNLALSKDELVKSIIGAIGKMDAYQLPDAKGYTAMIRRLMGETDAFRQQLRDELLDARAADFRAFGDALAELNKIGHIVVLGGEEAIDNANEQLSPPLNKTGVM